MEVKIYVVAIDHFNFITKDDFMTTVHKDDKIVTFGHAVYVQVSDSACTEVTIRDEFIKANPKAFKEV